MTYLFFSKSNHQHHRLSIGNCGERANIMLDSIEGLFYSHPSLAIMLHNPLVKRNALARRQPSEEANSQMAELQRCLGR
jgi:hypothetical protein